MYCRFCGIEIQDNGKFCHECGRSIAESDDKTKTISALRNAVYINPKDFIYLLWWTLLIFIIGIILYSDYGDFEDIIPIFPIYFGVILLVYTIRFFKHTQDWKKSSDSNNSKNAEDVTAYSLQKFSEIYGKMQICRYQDDYGVTHSKCVFTRSIDVYFGSDIGELNAKEIVENTELLLVQKKLYGDGYVLTVKDGKTIIRQPSSSVPPPLDKVLDKN